MFSIGLAQRLPACNERFEFDVPSESSTTTGSLTPTVAGAGGATTATASHSANSTDGTAGMGPIECPANCSARGSHCDPETGDCAQCLLDTDCLAALPRCDPERKRCVECVVSSDCEAGYQCDARAGRCAQTCDELEDCNDAAHACHDDRCVVCDRDVECVDPVHPLCAEGGLDCVACRVDAECSLEERCDPLSGQCVSCLSADDCSDREACDPIAHSCFAR